MSSKKKRLDILLIESGLVKSRERAKTLIMSGNVLVNDTPVFHPGKLVLSDSKLRLKEEDVPYVSRGGLKLAKALKVFNMDVKGLVCLDVGASTGGFTDCLLQNGAECVFAVDVGYGQLAWKLRQDSRVILFERTNIRHMPGDALPRPVDLTVIDVSFISLRIVVPSVLKFIKYQAAIIALIKPQFEIGKGKVGKGGIVKDPQDHDKVITGLASFFRETGLECLGITESSILGTKGNREFFIALKYAENIR